MDSASARGKVAPDLSSVTPLKDPRSWDGPSTAVVADDVVRAVEAGTPQLPTTVRDAQGTKVTVTDTSRILALDIYGTLSRTVFELGQGPKLVGRDISTQFPEASGLPLVTHNGHELNAESILALDPTVVLTDTSLGPWDVILQLRDSGIPVVVTDSERSLDNVDEITEQVAAALGVPDAGARLTARVATQLARTRAEIAAVAPTDDGRKLRTMFLYARGASGVYYMFGEGSGADSLIDALGLYDVAAEIGWKGSKPITDEAIVAAQPDVILMMTKGLESVGGVDKLLDRFPALAATPAGQHRRVVDMADAEILGYGPITPQVLNALAVAVYAPGAIAEGTK
ncbi:iron complex transport system substrate-binding protein [Marmoricola sp. OAE513]|uniref:heme/hemin ABC transporter substrate-binding protein n=1 Tax=Marmoricola sp. OAE513 TaxID=2817894 RepID=UPI001D8EF05E